MKKGIEYTGVSIVYLCHNGDGLYLFQKRSKQCRDEHNKWDIGGGALEAHDFVEDTLKKEIAEEYCTDVLEYLFLGYRDVHRKHNGEKTHWIALDFFVKVDAKKVQNGEPHKFSEIGWFSKKEIPHPLHSQLGIFFDLYQKKI
jgi:8-oxo-dGTP diphosphatase